MEGVFMRGDNVRSPFYWEMNYLHSFGREIKKIIDKYVFDIGE